MSEYIEREEVNVLIKAECSPKVAAYLIDAVAAIPAADVRPVVRGRWVLHDEVTSWDETWECSVCGEESDMLEGTPMDNSYNFCHACGADMRTSEEPESLTYIPPDERSGVEDG